MHETVKLKLMVVYGEDWGSASPSFFVQVNPPFRDQFFRLRGISLPILPQISQKTRGAFDRNAKKHETTYSVEHTKTHDLKCWLNGQVASFEAQPSLEKTIDDPTPSWSAVSFLRPCRTKTISRQIAQFPMYFFVSHRRNLSRKRNFVVMDRRIFGTENRSRRTTLGGDHFITLPREKTHVTRKTQEP